MRIVFAVALLCTASSVAARETVPLPRDWQVRIDPADTAATRAHPKEARWFPARVPGSVQEDLIRARRVPDPFVATNEGAIQWAGLTDWQFRTGITVTAAMLAHGHLDLVFDGLDTFATVRVNGRPLLTADNAHRRWRADAKALLRAGRNEIIVSIASPIRTLQPMVLKEQHPLPGEYDSAFGDEPKGVQTSPYIRKPKYQYGWDWGPRIVTTGLWRPARLEAWDEVRVDRLRVAQDALTDAEARLTAHATIVADRARTVTLSTVVTGPDGSRQSVARTVAVAPGSNAVTIPLSIVRPQRWQPVGYGAQPLYTVATTLDGDTQTRTIGLRTVTLDRSGGAFGFVVNGVPIFAKGANVIPFDSFPARVDPAEPEGLLRAARDANMNMVRIWGGGYYLDDAFYAAADRLGLMVWQDFMFGGSVTPPDAAFRASVAAEADEQVARLGDHPSIVLWAGNNEVLSGWENWSDRKAFKKAVGADEQERIGTGMAVLFDRVLRGAVVANSPGTPYMPGSPSTDYEAPVDTDANGDRHFWDVWSGSKPVENYLDSCPRFMSEYGFQAMPTMATIRGFAGKGALDPDSPVMKAHQKFLAGEGNARLRLYLDQRLRPARDFADFVYLTQVNQAQAIGLAARHHRACRPVTMGSLFWQLNDVWPSISWSSIDHLGQWKLLQYEAKRAFAPQAIVAEHRAGATRIVLVSDATAPVAAHWRITVRDMAGATLNRREAAVTLAPLGTTTVATLPDAELFGTADPARSYAVAELLIDGRTVSRALVERLVPRDMAYPDPGLTLRRSGDTATITARNLARAVMVDMGDAPGQASDSGFDLLPGESVTVTLTGKQTPTLRTLAR
ncbi:glycoside hydrolase family 2 protein [Sphingomonas sp. A2-49]|uniref:beta-mannosidase n=1 Tax=Sphingomonas sp. A2-49 TaxID=1391375 RepID=UPI0021D25D73|nr:glycoside hydrolase family 2 protein [Sphingomonas sp. A2-49]MCU6454315.1 glycoside hydrolase family 2 protein [Sphingomonas sp. A2-49]